MWIAVEGEQQRFWISFDVPSNVNNQQPPWSPVSIGNPAPKIPNQPSICRWGFGWVDKAQNFKSARWFGAVGSSPDFSRHFSRHDASRPSSAQNLFLCTTAVPRPTCVLFWRSVCACSPNLDLPPLTDSLIYREYRRDRWSLKAGFTVL